MEFLNKVELIGIVGNITKVPRNTKEFLYNIAVCVNDIYKTNSGGIVIDNTWIRVIYVGQDLDIKEREFVHVFGRLKTDKYVGSDGSTHSSYVVVANKIEKQTDNG